MKSDVMASIFMFTKNVGEKKNDGLKVLRFLIKKYNVFWVNFLLFLDSKISIVVTGGLKVFLVKLKSDAMASKLMFSEKYRKRTFDLVYFLRVGT